MAGRHQDEGGRFDPAQSKAARILRGDAPKLSKYTVHYRGAERGAKRVCGTCVMFREPDSCTLVSGKILRDDTCDRWAGK